MLKEVHMVLEQVSGILVALQKVFNSKGQNFKEQVKKVQIKLI